MRKGFYTTFLFIVIFLITNVLTAQVVIKGKVTDVQTEEGLDNVTISADNLSNSVSSNQNGEFTLETNFTPKKILVNRIGYITIEIPYQANITFYNIQLEPSNVVTSEVKVIGYRTNRTLLETPSSIGLLTRDDFKRTSGVRLTQSLNNIPGVKMETRNSLSTERIIIRGVGARSNFNIRGIKMYINDIPMTDASGNSNSYGIDPFSLGRLEVIKGPTSSLYGSNLGGVINLVTDRSTYGEKSFQVSGLYGTDNLDRITANLKLGTNSANILLNYNRQRFKGYREHSNDNKDFLTFLGQFYPGDESTITVFGNYSKVDFRIPGSLDSLQVLENPRQADPIAIQRNTGYKADLLRIGVSQLYNFSDVVSNSSSINVFGTYFDHPLTFAYLRSSQLSYSARSSFTFSPIAGKLNPKIIVGGEYIYNFSSDKNYVNNRGTEGAITADRELNYHIFSLFIQGDLDLTSKLYLTTGLSFNKFNYDVLDLFKANGNDLTGSRSFDPNFSPRIGLLYKFNDDLSVYTNASFGFSPPSIFEVFNNDGTVNNDINAEKGFNIEVGTKGSILNRRLNFDVSIFNLTINDEIIQRFIGQDISIFVNAGKTRHTGLEAFISYDFAIERNAFISLLRPFVGITYNDFKFVEYIVGNNNYSGNQLTGIPKSLINSGLDIKTPFGLEMYLTYQFVGKYPIVDNNSRFNEQYSLLNAKFSFSRRVSKNIEMELFGGGDNLLNESYSSFVMLNQQAFGPPGTLPKFFNPSPLASYYTGLILKYNF